MQLGSTSITAFRVVHGYFTYSDDKNDRSVLIVNFFFKKMYSITFNIQAHF